MFKKYLVGLLAVLVFLLPATLAIAKDKTPPVIKELKANPTVSNGGKNVSISFKVSEKSKVYLKFYRNNRLYATSINGTTKNAGLVTWTWVGSKAEGTYQVVASAEDMYKNKAKAQSLTLVIDKSSPVIYNQSTSNGIINPSLNSNFKINYILSQDAKVTLKYIGSNYPNGYTLATQNGVKGHNSFSWNGKLGAQPALDGICRFELTAVDQAGNISMKVYAQTVKDTIAPMASKAAFEKEKFNPSTESNAFSYQANEDVKAKLQVLDAEQNIIFVSENILLNSYAKTGQILWNGKNQAGAIVKEGTYTYKLELTDKAGNKLAANGSVKVSDGAPVITTEQIEDTFMATGTNSISLNYGLSEAANVTVKVMKGDNLVKTILTGSAAKGANTAAWNGKDENGNVVATGTYVFTVNAVDSVGNQAAEASVNLALTKYEANNGGGGGSNVAVTGITVSGAGNATTISADGGTLQMFATVAPLNATNPNVTWSVTNGTGKASISGGGLLTAEENGTVSVKAAANDGSNVEGSLQITITGQAIDGPVTISQAGTYDYRGMTVNGGLTINAPGVTLKNVTVTGDLTLGQGIGEGDVTLNGVTVQGNTIVNGGGSNSIHFVDSVMVTVIVNKNNGAVRVVAEGNTEVGRVVLETPAKVVENQITGVSHGFNDVVISESLQSADRAIDNQFNVVLEGSFETINNRAENIKIELSAATEVNNLLLNAVTEILGSNYTVNLAEVNAPGSTVSVMPENVVLDTDNNASLVVDNGTIRQTVTESISTATNAAISGIDATQGNVKVRLSTFIAGLTLADFNISATVDGNPITLENVQYNDAYKRITFNPIQPGENAGKELAITVAHASGKLSGDPQVARVTLGTGFEGRITDVAKVGMPGVTIKFRSGAGAVSGNVVGQVVTDKNGFYAINLPSGTYTGEFSGPGVITSYMVAAVADGQYRTGQNDTAIRAAGTNEIKIMLTWGDLPMDLDSHLVGPGVNGDQNFHTWYSNKRYTVNGQVYADLDWDDTDSYGPETTTIRKLVNGQYKFYVHNYSADERLRASHAKVEVFVGGVSTPTYTYDIPTGEGTERYWTAFTIDVSDNSSQVVVNPVNQLVDVLTGARMELEDVLARCSNVDFALKAQQDYSDKGGSTVEAVYTDVTDAITTLNTRMTAARNLAEGATLEQILAANDNIKLAFRDLQDKVWLLNEITFHGFEVLSQTIQRAEYQSRDAEFTLGLYTENGGDVNGSVYTDAFQAWSDLKTSITAASGLQSNATIPQLLSAYKDLEAKSDALGELMPPVYKANSLLFTKIEVNWQKQQINHAQDIQNNYAELGGSTADVVYVDVTMRISGVNSAISGVESLDNNSEMGDIFYAREILFQAGESLNEAVENLDQAANSLQISRDLAWEISDAPFSVNRAVYAQRDYADLKGDVNASVYTNVSAALADYQAKLDAAKNLGTQATDAQRKDAVDAIRESKSLLNDVVTALEGILNPMRLQDEIGRVQMNVDGANRDLDDYARFGGDVNASVYTEVQAKIGALIQVRTDAINLANPTREDYDDIFNAFWNANNDLMDARDALRDFNLNNMLQFEIDNEPFTVNHAVYAQRDYADLELDVTATVYTNVGSKLAFYQAKINDARNLDPQADKELRQQAFDNIMAARDELNVAISDVEAITNPLRLLEQINRVPDQINGANMDLTDYAWYGGDVTAQVYTDVKDAIVNLTNVRDAAQSAAGEEIGNAIRNLGEANFNLMETVDELRSSLDTILVDLLTDEIAAAPALVDQAVNDQAAYVTLMGDVNNFVYGDVSLYLNNYQFNIANAEQYLPQGQMFERRQALVWLRDSKKQLTDALVRIEDENQRIDQDMINRINNELAQSADALAGVVMQLDRYVPLGGSVSDDVYVDVSNAVQAYQAAISTAGSIQPESSQADKLAAWQGLQSTKNDMFTSRDILVSVITDLEINFEAVQVQQMINDASALQISYTEESGDVNQAVYTKVFASVNDLQDKMTYASNLPLDASQQVKRDALQDILNAKTVLNDDRNALSLAVDNLRKSNQLNNAITASQVNLHPASVAMDTYAALPEADVSGTVYSDVADAVYTLNNYIAIGQELVNNHTYNDMTAAINNINNASTDLADKTRLLNDASAVLADASVITEVNIKGDGNTDLASVTTSMNLPVSGSGGSDIAWTSSDETVIAADGTVVQPTGIEDATVTLTATITKGASLFTKVFIVTVLHQ